MKRDHPEYARRWSRYFIREEKIYDTKDLPTRGDPQVQNDLIHQNTLNFTQNGRRVGEPVVANSLPQALLLQTLATCGVRGLVRVPHDPDACQRIHTRFSRWYQEREEALTRILSERVGDEELLTRVRAAVDRELVVA